MNREQIEELAKLLRAGRMPLAEFVAALAPPASADLGNVNLDLDRQRRCGFPEVVFGEQKSVATLVRACARLAAENMPVLVTRVSPEKAVELCAQLPHGRYNEVARTFRMDPHTGGESATTNLVGHVAVVTAGTSDLPVAEEALETLDWMGVRTTLVADVGVAGPHRLPAQLHKLHQADAVVVVAGMEGALPSVVGGYVPCPVIGVPTSVGYGAALGGFAALLSMLNSCAANVTVVNIDAGFKAGYVAGLVARHRRAAK